MYLRACSRDLLPIDELACPIFDTVCLCETFISRGLPSKTKMEKLEVKGWPLVTYDPRCLELINPHFITYKHGFVLVLC